MPSSFLRACTLFPSFLPKTENLVYPLDNSAGTRSFEFAGQYESESRFRDENARKKVAMQCNSESLDPLLGGVVFAVNLRDGELSQFSITCSNCFCSAPSWNGTCSPSKSV